VLETFRDRKRVSSLSGPIALKRSFLSPAFRLFLRCHSRPSHSDHSLANDRDSSQTSSPTSAGIAVSPQLPRSRKVALERLFSAISCSARPDIGFISVKCLYAKTSGSFPKDGHSDLRRNLPGVLHDLAAAACCSEETEGNLRRRAMRNCAWATSSRGIHPCCMDCQLRADGGRPGGSIRCARAIGFDYRRNSLPRCPAVKRLPSVGPRPPTRNALRLRVGAAGRDGLWEATAPGWTSQAPDVELKVGELRVLWQAKPPAPPPRINDLRFVWGGLACRHFYHGLLVTTGS